MTGDNLNTILVLAGIIFNAGGICWLALNHFRSVGRRLEQIEERIHELSEEVSFIKGKLEE